MKLDLQKAFPIPEKRKPVRKAIKKYDVRISLNESGKPKQVVRFGFINNAAKIFGEHLYIEASDIEWTKDKIYFRSHDEKIHRGVYKVASNGKTPKDSCYFTYTPKTDKAEKMYRMNWIGKTFHIYYDNEADLHYIDMREEN